MPRKKQTVEQTSLFPGDIVSREELAASLPKRKRNQHEKKLMQQILQVARGMGLQAVHLEYYCGNTFYCPHCHNPVTCSNTINRSLGGHFDILGIAWAVETKHAESRKTKPKLDPRQVVRKAQYDISGVPRIEINENNSADVIKFLMERKHESTVRRH